MKTSPLLFIACLVISSAATKNKRGNTKFNSNDYCDALLRASSLIKSPTSIDPMKSCRKKCDVARLSSLWLPNTLEEKLKERQLDDVIMYYNLYKLQSWLAGQIRFNGCLAPGKTISKKNCKLRCCQVQTAMDQINVLFTYFPYANAKNQFKKLKQKAIKAFKNDRETRKMLKKSFRNKDFKLAKKLAKKTSSCLLHTEFVADKLTVLCDH